MSTALAIASVTQVLKDLLNNGMIDHDVTGMLGGNVVVTALPPDRVDATSANEQSQLNLFMYQATPNTGWRNAALPSLDASGQRISNPPLALDLHYLLSAYGASELHSDILLGYGMQLLHETPVLGRDAIRTSLAPPLPVAAGLPLSLQALSTSELADQVEQIKITMESLTAGEIFNLWTAFHAKYRPTCAYRATVVLIESRKSTRSALPVQRREIYVTPFRRAAIDRISSRSSAGAPIVELQKILTGYDLVIVGSQLQGDPLTVNVDGFMVTPATTDVSDKQIIIPVPAGLPAGVHGVQVIYPLLMGQPPLPHEGFSSNTGSFVLSPVIVAGSVGVGAVVGSGTALRSATVGMTIDPAIGPAQKVLLLLNEFSAVPPTGPLSAYSFPINAMTLMSPPGPAVTISIPVSGVKAGSYLVRIQVDGAESPVAADKIIIP